MPSSVRVAFSSSQKTEPSPTSCASRHTLWPFILRVVSEPEGTMSWEPVYQSASITTVVPDVAAAQACETSE